MRGAGLLIQASSYWAIAVVGPEDIDRINILHASLLAMRSATEHLPNIEGATLQVNGNLLPELGGIPLFGAEAIVQGWGSKVAGISAASILAKNTETL